MEHRSDRLSCILLDRMNWGRRVERRHWAARGRAEAG
jgi:hypothetical protein